MYVGLNEGNAVSCTRPTQRGAFLRVPSVVRFYMYWGVRPPLPQRKQARAHLCRPHAARCRHPPSAAPPAPSLTARETLAYMSDTSYLQRAAIMSAHLSAQTEQPIEAVATGAHSASSVPCRAMLLLSGVSFRLP